MRQKLKSHRWFTPAVILLPGGGIMASDKCLNCGFAERISAETVLCKNGICFAEEAVQFRKPNVILMWTANMRRYMARHKTKSGGDRND